MNRKVIKTIVATFTACFSLLPASSQNKYITNDQFWDTADGQPIYSQGGGIFRFTDPDDGRQYYFWYGVHYRLAERYRADPSVTQNGTGFSDVTCYRSTDLMNWQAVGPVLTLEETRKKGFSGWVGRMGVCRMANGTYALFIQQDSHVLVATSDSPKGPFLCHKTIDMKDRIGTSNTGDQTVFVDEDTGKAYLICSNAQGRNNTYICEIGMLDDGTIGLISCKQVYKGESREGNCMFKYKGKYYLCASNIYGWDSSYAYYLVADNVMGPYTPENKMEIMDGCERDYAHITQTGFFYTVRGSQAETVVYCGDRWCDFAGNGLGYNQWVPLSFRGDRPYFNSLSQWSIDASTGLWSVGPDNNYVLNPSFEADRRGVPNPVKPRQEFMMGWDNVVVSGNKVSFDNPQCPHLNYINTRDDRQHVIGEKSLCLADSFMDFERRGTQVVESTPFVPLPDGRYRVTLNFRDTGTFTTLEATAERGGKTYRTDLKALKSGNQWTRTTFDVEARGGRLTLTFHAKGPAMSQCLIDDVSMCRIAK